jgi:hypothetical protein
MALLILPSGKHIYTEHIFKAERETGGQLATPPNPWVLYKLFIVAYVEGADDLLFETLTGDDALAYEYWANLHGTELVKRNDGTFCEHQRKGNPA